MIRVVKRGILVFPAVLVVLLAGLEREADAIPAFARKYRTSCTTCHVAIPKRNAFGEAFRRNGYQIPAGDERYIKEEPVSLGAEAWKEMWPDAIWPGAIPGTIPFAAYVHQRFVFDNPNSHREFDAPHEFELLIGSTLGRNIGFFGEWVFFEKGKQAEGLKRFYIVFSNLFEDKLGSSLSLRVGRIEPGTADGYKDADRMTLDHIPTLDYRVVSGGFRLRDPQSGIEVAGVPHRSFEYVFGVVNGQKKTIKDPNNEKDVYFRVGLKLGGMGLDGSGADEGDELPIADNYVDDSVMLGFYGYRGFSTLAKDNVSFENDFRRIGVDARVNFGRNYVLAGLVRGRDDNPWNDGKVDVDSTVWFVEADRVFKPWIIGLVRYERLEIDHKDDVTRIVPNLTLLLRANIRASVEAVFQPSLDMDKFRTLKANVLFVF
ncbi:MAG: hypothetical protein ACE5JI_16105 [Acidobacteriota bacterium]